MGDFQKKFPGVIANAKVGFMNPDPNGMKNPSYRQVCSGATGHVEVLNVELTKKASETPEIFEEMMKFFYRFHDPTTLNRQGNDRGTQYGSVVFCSSAEPKIADFTTFYEAHEEHQEYLFKNPSGYCNHRYR